LSSREFVSGVANPEYRVLASEHEGPDQHVPLGHLQLVVCAIHRIPVSSQFDWTGGTMSGPATTVIAAASSLSISGSNIKYLNNGRILANAGTVIWTDTGNMVCTGVGLSTINNGGLFDIQNDQLVDSQSGAAVINNTGIFRKSASTGTNAVNARFTNSGTVDVQSGVISILGNYSPSASSTHSIHIGGLTPGTEFGQIQVFGAATLDGLLNVELVNSFMPGLGNTFAGQAPGGCGSNWLCPWRCLPRRCVARSNSPSLHIS
jgi:hypothetical protein